MIEKKEEQLHVKDVKEIGTDLYKGKKVESKLLVQTAAIENKKREKYDPKKDGVRDAITMGGRLPQMAMGGVGPTLRSVPTWR